MQFLFMSLIFLILLIVCLFSIKFLGKHGVILSSSFALTLSIILAKSYVFEFNDIVISTSGPVYMIVAFLFAYASLKFDIKDIIKMFIVNIITIGAVYLSLLFAEMAITSDYGNIDWISFIRNISSQYIVLILLATITLISFTIKWPALIKAIIILILVALFDGFIFKGVGFLWLINDYINSVWVDIIIKLLCAIILSFALVFNKIYQSKNYSCCRISD